MTLTRPALEPAAIAALRFFADATMPGYEVAERNQGSKE